MEKGKNKRMIKLKFIAYALFFLSRAFSQVDNLDWPNLGKYEKDNRRIKTTTKKGNRIVFIGNSITEGWDWHYPEYFKEKGYINRGISGQTTPQMLIRFRPDVIDLDPDIVVILAGINDIAENTGPSSVKSITDNIISMSELAIANNIKVIISSIIPAKNFPWRPQIDPPYKILRVNDILQSYALKNNLVYLDYFSKMHDGDGGLIKKYGIDSVHPNKEGYILMSQLLEKAIDSAMLPKTKEIDKFSSRVWKNNESEKLNYRLRYPENFNSEKKYPLLLFLHGSEGRGNDNEQQLWDANGIGAFSKQKIATKHESFVFAPQVPLNERWVSTNWNTDNYRLVPISSSMRLTFEALDSFIDNNKNIDENRIYVLGLSMGGWGAWDAISRRPNFFAAAVPICGGGDPEQAIYFKDVNIWAWHGEEDNVIDVKKSQDMVQALLKVKGNIKYSEIKVRGHDSWLDVWNSSDLWNWLYNQRK